MFEFRISCESGPAVMHLSGEILGDDDLDLLNEAFAFVQPCDHLILDLGHLDEISAAGAALVREVLVSRAALAESVVVSRREKVSMQLVLHDVDRVAPIVRTTEVATEILERPWANRRLPH